VNELERNLLAIVTVHGFNGSGFKVREKLQDTRSYRLQKNKLEACSLRPAA
jgi:hypothetical protein